jgi:hypothetical protein
MNGQRSEGVLALVEPWYKGFFLVLTTGLLALVVLSVVLTLRGEAAMAESDRAFHAGELRVAVWEAKEAGLAYVPGAAHVARGVARLEAIARGATAEGRWDLARLAWDSLRLLDEQTNYPGRGTTTWGARAAEGLAGLSSPRKGAPGRARE